MSKVIRICSKEGKENNIYLVKCTEVLAAPARLWQSSFHSIYILLHREINGISMKLPFAKFWFYPETVGQINT